MKKLIVGTKGKALLICLIAMVIGIIAWAMMLNMGLLQTTGMDNIFNWGLLIALFAFLVGFGAGGQLVASYSVLSKNPELEKFAIIAQSFAIAGAVGAGVAVTIDLGHPLNILNMIIHPNIASPLVWDMVALSAFIVVAIICLVALARNWSSKVVWMWIGAVVAVALQVVEGVLFASQGSRAWWHSFIMPIDFLVVACISGLSLIVLICSLSKRDGALSAAHTYAKLLFWFVVAHVVLSLCEVFGLWVIEQTPASEVAISLLGTYGILYAIELLLPLCAVIVLKLKKDAADAKACGICSALVIVGLFAHRMMLLYPALGSSTLFLKLSNQASPYWEYPVSTGFLESAKETFAITSAYIPSLCEWASALLPLGLACIIAIVAFNVANASHKTIG